jgi:hypothetical protein
MYSGAIDGRAESAYTVCCGAWVGDTSASSSRLSEPSTPSVSLAPRATDDPLAPAAPAKHN